MNCHKCDSVLSDDSKFCENCGAVQEIKAKAQLIENVENSAHSSPNNLSNNEIKPGPFLSEDKINELAETVKIDGKALYNASNLIFVIFMIFNVLCGMGGILLSLQLSKGMYGETGMILGLLLTAIVCFLQYIFAVLSTHVAKVLVLNLYTNMAILKSDKNKT
jgi:hypothetical protein